MAGVFTFRPKVTEVKSVGVTMYTYRLRDDDNWRVKAYSKTGGEYFGIGKTKKEAQDKAMESVLKGG